MEERNKHCKRVGRLDRCSINAGHIYLYQWATLFKNWLKQSCACQNFFIKLLSLYVTFNLYTVSIRNSNVREKTLQHLQTIISFAWNQSGGNLSSMSELRITCSSRRREALHQGPIYNMTPSRWSLRGVTSGGDLYRAFSNNVHIYLNMIIKFVLRCPGKAWHSWEHANLSTNGGLRGLCHFAAAITVLKLQDFHGAVKHFLSVFCWSWQHWAQRANQAPQNM